MLVRKCFRSWLNFDSIHDKHVVWTYSWPFSTIRWTFATLLSVVAVSGRPERSLSPKLVWPHLNSTSKNFTVVNDGADSPYTASNSSLLCVSVLRSKSDVNDRAILIFCIFTKNSHRLTQTIVKLQLHVQNGRDFREYLPVKRCASTFSSF